MDELQQEAASASQQRQKALTDLDKKLGLMSIGEISASRVALDKMGARVAGAPLSERRFTVSEADQGLIDQVTFSASHLETYLAACCDDTGNQATATLFELASLRSQVAPALLSDTHASATQVTKLERLLKSVQNVNLNDMSAADSLPAWADKVRSGSVQTLGSGLQLYGFYSAIQGIGEAIRTGDTATLLFEAGALTAEGLSVGLELALERIGKKMMGAAHAAYSGFGASRAGLLLRRGAGLIASILTVPFDLAQAGIALSNALKSKGKEAQDLYVEAGLSLASATLSIGLGVAALAGFSAAGPVGVLASALLIIGARAYAAGRVVDEIDDYIELSTHERLRSGWFSFAGIELDESVLDRYKISRTHSVYSASLKTQARALLDGELKDSVQAVVNGKFEVRLQTVQHWKYQWDDEAGESPYTKVREPVIQDADDYIDAGQAGAIDQLPDATWGTKGPEKGVVWLLGGGNDFVAGMRDGPNHFHYDEGKKHLVGGSQNDEFMFNVPPGTFAAVETPVPISNLIGNAGIDTLNFAGVAGRADAVGFNVNLDARTVHLVTDNARNGEQIMRLWGIENVSTLAGASSVVTGTGEANRIVLKGRQDNADAKAGDDQLLINGVAARVNGGPGADYYEISESARDVVIEEDGQQQSLILLNWAFNRIQRWWIAGNDLKVTSTRGQDGEWPGPSVTIENVYVARDGKRCLVNKLFSFLTQDGYRIVPLLLEELEAAGAPQVSMEVVVPSGPTVFPVILGPGQSVTLAPGSCNYFVVRGHAMTTVETGVIDERSRCCLYVDYDSSELAGVYTSYDVSSRRCGNFEYLYYENAQIAFKFDDGRILSLNDYAAQRVATWTSVGGALQASAFKLRAEFIVVMRNGVSYRLLPPTQSYIRDHASPGYTVDDGMRSLVLRYGHYPFFRPRRAKNINLTARPQRVELCEAPHTSSYLLSGRGGVYEVYLTSWANIELSTPGALRKTSDASTWDVYCTGLVESVDIDSIVVSAGHLKIGSVSVQVPVYDDPDVPLENIRIHSREGARYDIRLDIKKAYLSQVTATLGSSVAGLLKLLRQSRQRSTVFVPLIPIVGINMADGTLGGIYYDVAADDWKLKADGMRPVSADQLVISI